MLNATAQVARLLAPGRLVFDEEPFDAESLGAREVAAITEWSAISTGTETAAYLGLPPLRSDVAPYPRVVGYCNVAHVVAVGADVLDVSVGDRIVTFQSHRSHFIVDVSCVMAIVPDDLDPRLATVTYLFHLGYDAFLKGDAFAGMNALVVGLGPLGLGAVAVGDMAGMRIAAVSDHEIQRERACRMGSIAAFDRDDPPERIRSFGKEPGIDLVVLTSNGWEDFMLALKVVRQGGVICVVGFPGRLSGRPPFNPLQAELFYQKQLTIRAVGFAAASDVPPSEIRFTTKRNMNYLIDRIASGSLPAAELISGEYDAFSLQKAYEDLLAHRGNPVTYILRWPGADENRI